MDWTSAPVQVRLPPQTFRFTTASRMACSARQLGTPRRIDHVVRHVFRHEVMQPRVPAAHPPARFITDDSGRAANLLADPFVRRPQLLRQTPLRPAVGTPVGGFLVSGYSAADYGRFLDSEALLFLAEADGIPIAFLLAWHPDKQREPSMVENAMREASSRATVIKQVAVASNSRGQGIGRHLYSELQNAFPDRALVAAIVSEPRNVASETFHESPGFYLIQNVTAEDGIARSIWLRDNTPI